MANLDTLKIGNTTYEIDTDWNGLRGGCGWTSRVRLAGGDWQPGPHGWQHADTLKSAKRLCRALHGLSKAQKALAKLSK